jgi:hypothetical protein
LLFYNLHFLGRFNILADLNGYTFAMNDPGTAEPIDKAERDLEKRLEVPVDDDDEAYNFLDPRYGTFRLLPI